MVDLVVPYYRVAVGANLYAGEGVTVDVVVLDEASPLAEDIHAALVAVVDLVFPADSEQLNHVLLRLVTVRYAGLHLCQSVSTW